jgi:putative ABC transport system permease protein
VEIVRGLVEGRLRATLAVAVVAIGVAAAVVTASLADHFSAQFAGGVAYYRSAIQVADDAGSAAGVISLAKIDPIQRVPGVAAALPTIAVLARPGTVSPIPLATPDTVGYTDPRERAYSPLRTTVASGRQLDPNRQGEVVLGAGIAGELGARVGDTVDLPVRPRNAGPDFASHPFRVAGILRPTGTLPDRQASVGLLDAQTLLQESLPASFRDRVDPSSLASGITVYGKPGVNLDALADRIDSAVPGVAATRPSDSVRTFDQGAGFTALAAATAALAALLGGLVVAAALLVAVAERRREVALKMAFGAHAWHVAAECVLEALALTLAGGVLGLALGAGLAGLLDLAGRGIEMDVFRVSDRVVELALALAAGSGAAAALVPALRAARVDPDLALRTH